MIDPKDDPATEDSIQRRHETSDADFKKLMVTGIGLLGVMVAGFVISFFAYTMFTGYSENPGASPDTFVTGGGPPAPGVPGLQASPRDSFLVIRRAEDSLLAGYGWTDNDSGLVRVPIDRAKQVTLQRGLPTREGKEQQ